MYVLTCKWFNLPFTERAMGYGLGLLKLAAVENKPTKFSHDVMPSSLPVAVAMIDSMALDPGYMRQKLV